jgi:PERQ amino acid-rich with GYF domain-containing protein
MNANYQSSYNRNGSSSESRYSKDQLLDLFRAQEKSGISNINLSDLYVDGWNPNTTNGTSNGGWGKRDDHKDATGPEICWDHEGSVQPLALAELTEEEKEVAHHSMFTLAEVLLMKVARHSLRPSIRH